jgi:simple sugar transport system permease protein
MMKKLKLTGTNISLAATIILFILLFLAGASMYDGFMSFQVFFNLFIDNGFLIVIATGEAFVILGKGIDLSVGAVVAFVSMITASLLSSGVNAVLVIVLVLLFGILFGTAQGYLIERFKIHPWIVTLAGMFFARGASYLISTESIVITDPVFMKLSQYKIRIFSNNFISISVVISLIVVILAVILATRTSFGRNIYAIGGSEQSALLMGLPVKKTKIMMYTLSGFCSSLGGLIFTIYMLSGYGLHCNGLEMDAIAACVIGGILLTGGYGNIIGPMFGVLSMGVIQTIIMFQGNLNSWWTKIVVGALLFIFIALQRFIVTARKVNDSSVSAEDKKVNSAAGNM